MVSFFTKGAIYALCCIVATVVICNWRCLKCCKHEACQFVSSRSTQFWNPLLGIFKVPVFAILLYYVDRYLNKVYLLLISIFNGLVHMFLGLKNNLILYSINNLFLNSVEVKIDSWNINCSLVFKTQSFKCKSHTQHCAIQACKLWFLL